MPWEKQFNEDVVLDKALQIFWQRGYESTSMQDLVDGTGVNRASLYATYGDKRALFFASLERYDENRRKMLAVLETKYAPPEAIRQVFMAFARDIDDPEGARGCFLTNTALELAAHDPEVRRFVATAQEHVEAYFVRLVRKGQAEGIFSSHLTPADAGRSLLASMLGFVVLVRSRPEPTLLKSVVHQALRQLE